MLRDYIGIALKSLSKRRTRTYLTMIGIFIGIAAVIALIGLGQGLRNAITGQFGFLGTDVLSVQASGIDFAGPPGQGVPNPLNEDLIDKIQRIQNVDAVFARHLASGSLEFNDRREFGFATSVPEGPNRRVFETMSNLKTSAGRMLKDGDARKIVVGNDFSDPGNSFGRAIVVGDDVLLNNITFEVVGILEKKGSFIFDTTVFVNEGIMLDLLKTDTNPNIIAVKVTDQDNIQKTKTDIEKLLRKERDVDEGEEDFVVQTPQSALESLNNVLFGVQLFLIIIACISVLVGGIGIMNTMYTSVLERSKEIGIMKSIGARNSTIFTLFFIESGLLGMVGGIIGVLLGLGLAYGAALGGRLALGTDLIQASVPLWLIGSALAFSFILGSFFGVLPAYRASRLNPVDSLRSAK